MTRRFGSGLAVIPNLFRDLGFRFRNLGFKAPPCRRGSLLGCKSLGGDVKINWPRFVAGPIIQVLIFQEGLFYPLISLGIIMWW